MKFLLTIVHRCIQTGLESTISVASTKLIFAHETQRSRSISQRFISLSSETWKSKSKRLDARSEVRGKDASVEHLSNEDDKTIKLILDELDDNLHGISLMAVLQPWIKWGHQKKRTTTSALLLEEACSLAHSLPRVRVTYKEVVPLLSVCKSRLFGSGSLEKLVLEVRSSLAQAVFVSVDHLSRVQRAELESAFGVPVFDRFFVVLSIFKHYAKTYEAKLQVSLADMPLKRKKSLSENEKMLLDRREALLKSALKRLSERKERVRRTRAKSSFASVAVVGYTNCGKTTLIRSLTGDRDIEGEDRLFATLDVTAHKTLLPSGLKVLLIDTVGFIRDVPTSLVASFRATLEDAACADAVLFVRDISHPDVDDQTSTVIETLRSLSLPTDTPVLTVNNKVDLLSASEKERRAESEEDGRGMFASGLTGEGLSQVLVNLERELFRVTGRNIYRMKLPTGSPKIEWLRKHVSVVRENYDPEDPQTTLLLVALNEAEKAHFRRAFS